MGVDCATPALLRPQETTNGSQGRSKDSGKAAWRWSELRKSFLLFLLPGMESLCLGARRLRNRIIMLACHLRNHTAVSIANSRKRVPVISDQSESLLSLLLIPCRNGRTVRQ